MANNIYGFSGIVDIFQTTVSTSPSVGALVVNGGVGMKGKISIGSALSFYGSKSNYISLQSVNSAAGIALTLPSASPYANNTCLVSDTNGNLSYSTNFTFTGANNQSSPAIVTGLVFNSSCEIIVTVTIVATTNLTQRFRLYGIFSGSSSWNIYPISTSGDTTNVNFSINSAGLVTYTSPSYPGFVSLTFNWNTLPSVSSNITAGINTTSSIFANTGGFVTVYPSNFTDSGTSASSTAVTFNANYIGVPTLAASNTGVTTTTASTVYIAGAPTAGTHETITNSYALNVGGNSYFNGIVTGAFVTGAATISATSIQTFNRIGANGYMYNTQSTTIGTNSVNTDLRVVNKRIKSSRINAVNALNGKFVGRNSVNANNWYGCCWSPELQLFVSVANSTGTATVQTSSDGIVWTVRTAGSTGYWTSVCWSPELSIFVAVSLYNTSNTGWVMTSSNGTTWTQQTTPSGRYFANVCWSPELSLFVAVSSSQQFATSTNGTTWTTGTLTAGNTSGGAYMGLCWSPELSMFVIANVGATSGFLYSYNGTTWNTVSQTGVANNWTSVCWSPELGLFLATSGYVSTNYIAISTNGISWTLNSFTTPQTLGCCWIPELSIFIIAGTSGSVFGSSDGINWTTYLSIGSGTLQCCCWSPELGTVVISGGTTGNMFFNTVPGTVTTLNLPQQAVFATYYNSSAVSTTDATYLNMPFSLLQSVGNSGITYASGSFTNSNAFQLTLLVTYTILWNSNTLGFVHCKINGYINYSGVSIVEATGTGQTIQNGTAIINAVPGTSFALQVMSSNGGTNINIAAQSSLSFAVLH